MLMRCIRLYSPVLVVLAAALVAGFIDRGVGLTVVFLVVLGWSITTHIKATGERIRREIDR